MPCLRTKVLGQKGQKVFCFWLIPRYIPENIFRAMMWTSHWSPFRTSFSSWQYWFLSACRFRPHQHKCRVNALEDVHSMLLNLNVPSYWVSDPKIWTQLNYYTNWLRTVTESMSRIYIVIEIYFVLIILFSPVISIIFLIPLLLLLLYPFSTPVITPSLIISLCTYDLHHVHIRTLNRKWQIWANIDESDLVTWTNIFVLTAKQPRWSNEW